ncbi:DUF3152 domain-containing protein [Humibacillus xanthopallidus]|uniref:DUF3152 domain-containing protein n=1 Tax=Humibacillus xanthopallidus TaxID=412689 RepID=UPI0011507580|nr:DUF3152 domain-containing protein [Humibacillus xanthopallidus]
MHRGGGAGGPADSRRQQVHRRRVVAAAALVGCLVADVWAVAAAGAGEVPESALSSASRVSVTTGLAVSVPLDDVERVPETVAAPAPSGTGPSAPTAPAGTAAKVVERGSGTMTAVVVPASALGTPPSTGRTVRWTLEAEGGLGVDTTALATTVATVLRDPRGWQTKDGVRFVNVSPAEVAKGDSVDLRITLASPDTTDRLCAPLETRGQVSCHNGGRVVLNARRWILGAEAYGTDLAGYRTYLVNHEVGHGLGHGHAYCGGAGKVAPVMMQQTYGLKGCTAWPWPTPKAS